MAEAAYFLLALFALGADAPGETAYVHPDMFAPAPVVLPLPPDHDSAAWEKQKQSAALMRLDELLHAFDPFVQSGKPTDAPFLTERERSAAAVVERMSQAGTGDLRLRALEVAADEDDPGAILRVLAAADTDSPTRRQAERAMAEMDPAEVAATLLDLLAATPAEERPQVLETLPQLSAPFQAPLLDILKNEDPALPRVQFAAQCLGKAGSAEAVPLLVERAWHADPLLAYSYAYALFLARAPAVLPEWHRMMAHPEASVRALAQESLVSMGGDAEVKALYDAASGVTEADAELQIRAVQWLGTLKEPFVIPLMVELMEKNVYIRQMAGQILRQKTGAEVGDEPAQWRAWMKMVQQMNTPPLVPSQDAAQQ